MSQSLSLFDQRIRNLVDKVIGDLESTEEFSDKDVKNLETLNKMVDVFLKRDKETEKPTGFEEKSDEDLLRAFEEGE